MQAGQLTCENAHSLQRPLLFALAFIAFNSSSVPSAWNLKVSGPESTDHQQMLRCTI